MIDSLNLILRRMFVTAFGEILDESGTTAPGESEIPEIRFDAPNDSFPPQGEGPLLNVFLLEIRENRKLRTNDRITLGVGDNRQVTRVPSHLDCHYLVSAWVRQPVQPDTDTQAEHRLLYHAAAALLRHNPIVARDIYNTPQNLDDLTEDDGAAFNDLPNHQREFLSKLDKILRDRPLPIDALAPEGYSKISEFWGLMGSRARWRPTLSFIVTLPVEYLRRAEGPIVRSINTSFVNTAARRLDRNALDTPLIDRESFIAIDGRVLQGEGRLSNYPVQLLLKEGGGNILQTRDVRTDNDGHFRFDLLADDVMRPLTDHWELTANGVVVSLPVPIESAGSYDINLP